MSSIKVIHQPSQEELNTLDVFNWPVWTKETSEFPWTYDSREICYIVEGEVYVIPDNGEVVHIVEGDLVTFPKGMSCTWRIIRAIKKHYQFD